MNGRIGAAKRIHVIEKFVPQQNYNWGSALCGWTGTCVETDEEPTCFRCRMASRDLERQKLVQKKGVGP
jgi:hypothetical protein